MAAWANGSGGWMQQDTKGPQMGGASNRKLTPPREPGIKHLSVKPRDLPPVFTLTSQHRGSTGQGQDSASSAGLAWQERMQTSTLQATRPHSRRRDRNQLQAEATVPDKRKQAPLGRVGLDLCPIQEWAPRASQRPHRRVGAAFTPRDPCHRAPMLLTHSRVLFVHHWGQHTRTHICCRKPKRSRIRRYRARVPVGSAHVDHSIPTQSGPSSPLADNGPWVTGDVIMDIVTPAPGNSLQTALAGPRTQACPAWSFNPVGWTHERHMGSSGAEQLSQLDSDADLPDGTDAAGSPAALLEEFLQDRDKQPPNNRQGPFFYIGGSNGASIISAYCRSKGWQRTQDSQREDYRLKWCEIKCRDNYHSFREGQQLLFQLPNNKVLTTKIGLLSALREHERTLSKVNQMPPGAQARVPKMEDFFPETYRLDISNERQTFFTLFDETQIWICKPTASNQGKGIFLIRSQEELATLQAKIHSTEDGPLHSKISFRGPQARVVQRYIQNPLLLNGKKFDVRSYLLIACAVPYMVFFGHGYARLTLNLYDPHSSDLSGHLTNQFMQKRSPLYMLLKEDTVWSMDHLNCYINDKFQRTKGLPQDWVFTTFTRRMQQIMAHCFLAVKSKLECKLGYFDLIGCDFLIDENFKVWLLEMNSNPALHTNCEVLKKVIPGVVMETLDLALETSQKSLRGQKMLPLRSQRRFTILHNGEAEHSPSLRLRPAASRARPRPPAPPRPRPPGPTPTEQPPERRGTGHRGS